MPWKCSSANCCSFSFCLGKPQWAIKQKVFSPYLGYIQCTKDNFIYKSGKWELLFRSGKGALMLKIPNNFLIRRLMMGKTLFSRLFLNRYKVLTEDMWMTSGKFLPQDCTPTGEAQKTSTSSNGSSASSGDWFANIFNYSKVF